MITVKVVEIPQTTLPSRKAKDYPDGTLLRSGPIFILRVGKVHAFDFSQNKTFLAALYLADYSPVNAELVVMVGK